MIQLNLSATATLGKEESGLCRVRFKQELMYGLSAKKMWPLVEVRLYNTRIGIRTTLYQSLIATSVNN